MNIKFKEMAGYFIHMGLYLNTVSEKEFAEQKKINENMVNFLMQAYLYLSAYNFELPQPKQQEQKASDNNDDDGYLTRKQVLEMYSPLFTSYALSQAIHTNGFPYVKRGNKYFFKKSEIDKWLKENGDNRGNKRIKFV